MAYALILVPVLNPLPTNDVYLRHDRTPIKVYMGGLILGVNTLYRLFCFFKLFPMVGKGSSLLNTLCSFEHPCLELPLAGFYVEDSFLCSKSPIIARGEMNVMSV